MTLNEHVKVDTEQFEKADVFTPDEGYALWDETEDGNLDADGNPRVYITTLIVPKSRSSSLSSHIFAKSLTEIEMRQSPVY